MNSCLQQPSRHKFHHCIPEVDKYSIWVMSHEFPSAFQEDLEAHSGLRICKKLVCKIWLWSAGANSDSQRSPKFTVIIKLMDGFCMGSISYQSVCTGRHNFSAFSQSSSEGRSDLHVSYCTNQLQDPLAHVLTQGSYLCLTKYALSSQRLTQDQVTSLIP